MECEADTRYSVFRRPQYAPRPSESWFGGIGAFAQATVRCGWILRRVGLYADRAEVPFGKLLGLPFMRLSGRRADCLPRMVDLAAKCFFRRPQSMEAV